MQLMALCLSSRDQINNLRAKIAYKTITICDFLLSKELMIDVEVYDVR